jgi:hypothetical protein
MNTSFSVNQPSVSNNVNLTTITEIATVTIILSTNDGGSVNNALVRLTNNDGNPAHIYQTNATSHTVVMPNVVFGTYTLFVSLNGYINHSNPNLSVNAHNISSSVPLTPIQTSAVTITVHTHDSLPVNNAVVRLVNNNQDPSLVYQEDSIGNTATFSSVVYGTYTLTITFPGYALFTSNPFSVYAATINRAFTLQGFQIGGLCPAGGMIFYDKGNFSDGWRYMSLSPIENVFSAQFSSNYSPANLPLTGSGIGTGKANTIIIANFLNGIGLTGMAAQRSLELNVNGFIDWFLPSSGELRELRNYFQTHNPGQTPVTLFWTSTAYNIGHYWWITTVNFQSGQNVGIPVTDNRTARPIRQF